MNNMEPLNPSDAMMMPAAMPSSERTLILAKASRLSLRRTARLENMEPLNPSDAMMMPAAMPSSERTLILAKASRLSLRRTARLENLHSNDN